MDIIHYAMHHQYKKILLLEDDILLGNPSWIEHFCNTEPFIPEWYILNIGENMFNSKNIIPQMYLNDSIKYYKNTVNNRGTFGISISQKMFPILWDIFSINATGNHTTFVALDGYGINY
eukprot:355849_1